MSFREVTARVVALWRDPSPRPHPLDVAFAAAGSRAKLFAHGWGDEALLESLSTALPFAPSAATITPSWSAHRTGADGTFASPVTTLPREVRTARVRWHRAARNPTGAACVVLAASREEGYAMRTRIYAPLTRQGIDVLFLENPFYGARRPTGQPDAAVRSVSEHLTMNFASVEEARALLGWLRAQGYGRVCIAGYSMGGYMAAVTAALTPHPVGAALLAAGASPAPVFTRGLLSWSIDFAALGGSTARAEIARARLAALFETANVTRWAPPPRPTAAVLVVCARDGFVPRAESEALHAHWTGSELRRVDGGHVSAVVTSGRVFRAAVRDALARVEVAAP